MDQDEKDFSGESTEAIAQWKRWFLRAIEETGSTPAKGAHADKGVEHIRELYEGLKAAEAELAKR